MLYVSEDYVNATKGWLIGESGVYKSFTDDRGTLYRSCLREHGRCVSRVYIDGPDGKPRPIGWVFVKRKQYEDTGETYLAETWVTLHEKPPTMTTEYHYA